MEKTKSLKNQDHIFVKGKTIIENLKKLREGKGISTYQLSNLTGISQPNISRLERPTSNSLPTLETLLKITEALQVEVHIF